MSEKFEPLTNDEAIDSPEALILELAALQQNLDALKNLTIIAKIAGPDAVKQIFS